MNLFSYNLPTYKITKPIRLIELFAGVGSQAKALTNLGVEFEHYKVIEFDKFAIRSYNAVHNTNFETTDITQITGVDLEIRERDKYEYILTYSFPCQDISLAGTRAGMGKGTRSGLLWEVERLLNELEELPQVLLLENVPQVIGKDNVQHFAKWVEFLESKGYSNYTDTLNAKDYGVAQNRNRSFMVSILGEWNYNLPRPIPLEKTIKDYLEPEVDEKYYIKNDKAQELINQLIESGKVQESRHNMTELQPREDGISNTLITVQKDNYLSEPTIKIKQATSEGYIECKLGGVADLSFPNSKTRRGRVQENGDICPTLMAAESEVYKIESPYRIRKLTPLECWRLMGFRDEDFYKAEKTNSNSQLYKQAGNSIVVDVLENIFKQLL